MEKLKNKILVFAFAFIILFSTISMASTTPANNTKGNPEEAVTTSLNTEGKTNQTASNETNGEASSENASNENANENTIYTSDYFAAGQNVELNKLVDGNSFAMGDTINVTGQINGDLFVLGNKVIIDENAIIYNNLFVLAKELVINGTVYNLYSLSTDLILGQSAIIYRDMASYSNKITFEGRVQRDVFVTANELNFPDNSKTLVYGSFNYTSVNEANIPDGIIKGDINFKKIDTSIDTSTLILNYIIRFVATVIFVLAVVLFLIFFTPKAIDRAKYNLIERPFATTGIGILGIALIPFIVVLLMTLSVTLPLAMTLAVIYGILVSLAFSFFAIAIAKYLVDKFNLQKKWQLALFTIISALVMYALTIIPAIGGYAKLFFIVVGFGIVLVSIFSKKFEKTDKKETSKKTEKNSNVETKKVEKSNSTENKKENKSEKKSKTKKDKEENK
ncbi:MAG: hypothetical protein UIT70_02620 [Clostridia bacterium]|nr:hypothetical protein [Clostridia bacterium]